MINIISPIIKLKQLIVNEFFLYSFKMEKGGHYILGIIDKCSKLLIGYSLNEGSDIVTTRVTSFFGGCVRSMRQKTNSVLFTVSLYQVSVLTAVKKRTKILINYAVSNFTTRTNISVSKVILSHPSNSYQCQILEKPFHWSARISPNRTHEKVLMGGHQWSEIFSNSYILT